MAYGNLSIEKWGNLRDLPAARGWCKRFAEAPEGVGADTDE